ncbi:MAG: hypothetical protein Q9185_001646 [Variospora sp. 1 TL-2023]
MRQHHVDFEMTAPDGAWYFVRDPSKPEGDDEEGVNDSDDSDDEPDTESDTYSDSDSFFDSSSVFRPDTFNERREERAAGNYPSRCFRTLPSDTLINPLLLAMARSAACMPKLEEMSLTSTMRDPDGAGFEVRFYAVGHVRHDDLEPGDSDQARLDWSVGAWRPNDEVLDVWREGRDGLLVRFIEW